MAIPEYSTDSGSDKIGWTGEKRQMKSMVAAAALCAASTFAQIGAGGGQNPLFGGGAGGAANGIPSNASGPQLYSVTASAGALSTPGFIATDRLTGVDPLANFSAALGYRKAGARGSFGVFYAPSYMVRPRFPEWNRFGHYLSINTTGTVSDRMRVFFAATGGLMEFDQTLFSPTRFAVMTQTPRNFDDLLNGVLAGRFNNDQIASLLTGTPIVESPAQLLLYGNRLLTFGATLGASYNLSARTTFTIQGQGARSQNYTDIRDRTQNYNPILAATTMGIFNAGVNHSLTPNTFVGASVAYTKASSRLNDRSFLVVNGSVGRVFARKLLTSVSAGGGQSYQQTGRATTGARYQVSGMAAFQATSTHTFSAQYLRSFVDTIGLGLSSQQTAMAAWSISPGQRKWSVIMAAAFQDLERDGRHVRGMFGNAGLSRQLGLHFGLSGQVFYSTSTNGFGAADRTFERTGARMSLSWYPKPLEY